jgi:hypothetical protein
MQQSPLVDEIVVMMAPGHLDEVRAIVKKGEYAKVTQILEGGEVAEITVDQPANSPLTPLGETKVLHRVGVFPCLRLEGGRRHRPSRPDNRCGSLQMIVVPLQWSAARWRGESALMMTLTLPGLQIRTFTPYRQ